MRNSYWTNLNVFFSFIILSARSFSVCELTDVHKNAIRAIRKIKYFVARKKFQVNILNISVELSRLKTMTCLLADAIQIIASS